MEVNDIYIVVSKVFYRSWDSMESLYYAPSVICVRAEHLPEFMDSEDVQNITDIAGRGYDFLIDLPVDVTDRYYESLGIMEQVVSDVCDAYMHIITGDLLSALRQQGLYVRNPEAGVRTLGAHLDVLEGVIREDLVAESEIEFLEACEAAGITRPSWLSHQELVRLLDGHVTVVKSLFMKQRRVGTEEYLEELGRAREVVVFDVLRSGDERDRSEYQALVMVAVDNLGDQLRLGALSTIREISELYDAVALQPHEPFRHGEKLRIHGWNAFFTVEDEGPMFLPGAP